MYDIAIWYSNHGRDDFKIALGYKKAAFFLVAHPEALLETWELQVEIDSATKNLIYQIPSLEMENSTFVVNLEDAVSDTVVKVVKTKLIANPNQMSTRDMVFFIYFAGLHLPAQQM